MVLSTKCWRNDGWLSLKAAESTTGIGWNLTACCLPPCDGQGDLDDSSGDGDFFFFADWSADRLRDGEPIPSFKLVFHEC